MAKPLSHKELLELEQKKAGGGALVEAATSFLRCDLDELKTEILSDKSARAPRKSLAPREEFVLKLLLRRLSSSEDVLDGYYWVLLGHLVHTVPSRSLARLFGERDFLASLDQALETILLAESASSLHTQYDKSSDEDSGRPTKKQKLGRPASRDRTEPVRVLSLVCNTITSLVQLTTRNAEHDDISRNAIRNVLSVPPEEAGNFVGKLLRVFERRLYYARAPSGREQLAQALPVTLLIWTYRRLDTVSGSSENPSDQYFTAQCLRPALQLITALAYQPGETKTTACRAAVKDLERLIALHSVLPLRSRFLAERAQQWKTKSNSITWHDLEELYTIISTMLLEPILSEADTVSETLFEEILRYYSIAVRVIPRPTIRSMQHEQPWLDCLFCACAYLGDPTVPKLERDESGQMIVIASADKRFVQFLSTNLNELFTLTAARAVKLSLPVLLYFMAALLEGPTDGEHWRILAKIVEQDVNVLVPNSGLLETPALLQKILGLISSTNNKDVIDYPLVRDGIIRPLLRGFAQARDLKGFVSLWLSGLQNAIQQRASGDLTYGRSHLSVVWEDQLLFKDFEATTKALATSTFTQWMTTEMLMLLQEADTRIGPTSDILSHIAITTSLLNTRSEDLDTATIARIVAGAISAISRRSDYQSHRWRLWKLLRQCLPIIGKSANIDDQLQQLTENEHFVSLSSVANLISSDDGYIQDARLREALECFRLMVTGASQFRATGKSLFEREFKYFIALFSSTENSKHKQSKRDRKQLDFVSTCLGIILQQPQVLQHSLPATKQLIAAMAERLPSSSLEMDARSLAPLIKTLLLTEEISNNAELFNECCFELFHPVTSIGRLCPCARDIFIALPMQALKKSLAEKLADTLVESLQSDAMAARTIDQVLPDLGLLEMLIATFSVSVGRPKRWAEFLVFAEHVLSYAPSAGSEYYQSASGCISKIFQALWNRCQTKEMSGDMSASLLAFQSRLQDLERSMDLFLLGPAKVEPEEELQSTQDVEDRADFRDMSELTTKELEEIATRISMQVSALGSQISSELARLVDEEILNSRDLLLLSAIICRVTVNDTARDHDLLLSMSSLATLKLAMKVNTAADLSLVLEIGEIILERYPSAINQHTIDTLLSSITALTSPVKTSITSKSPHAIFDRLCSLVGHALSRHRKRLGGRYHLLLPAMQGLLKCLFFAGTSHIAASQTKSQIAFIHSLPSWLRSSEQPLGPKSAEHFTRLLTTICDPSVSSIRRKKKSNELTDETKKARSLAGQYMQYLIMDFCRCSLHGRIPSSSKEKLMPGLYAVLDVMDRETMRGMNGAMDSNGRAVWKGLYQDWERFGRWDGK